MVYLELKKVAAADDEEAKFDLPRTLDGNPLSGATEVGLADLSLPYSSIPLTSSTYEMKKKLYVDVRDKGVTYSTSAVALYPASANANYIARGVINQDTLQIQSESDLRRYINTCCIRAAMQNSINHSRTVEGEFVHTGSGNTDDEVAFYAKDVDNAFSDFVELDKNPVDAFACDVSLSLASTISGTVTMLVYSYKTRYDAPVGSGTSTTQAVHDPNATVDDAEHGEFNVHAYELGHLASSTHVKFTPAALAEDDLGNGIATREATSNLLQLPSRIAFVRFMRKGPSGVATALKREETSQSTVLTFYNSVNMDFDNMDRKLIGKVPLFYKEIIADQVHYTLRTAAGFFSEYDLHVSPEIVRRLGIHGTKLNYGLGDSAQATAATLRIQPDLGANDPVGTTAIVNMNATSTTFPDVISLSGEVQAQTTIFDVEAPCLTDVVRLEVKLGGFTLEEDIYMRADPDGTLKLYKENNILYTFVPGQTNNDMLLGAKTLLKESTDMKQCRNALLQNVSIDVRARFSDGGIEGLRLDQGEVLSLSIHTKGTTDNEYDMAA